MVKAYSSKPDEAQSIVFIACFEVEVVDSGLGHETGKPGPCFASEVEKPQKTAICL